MSNIVSVSADGRGIAREWEDRLNEASGIIRQYCLDGDDSRLQFEHSLDSLVAKKHNTKGGEAEEWEDKIQAILKSRATDSATVYPLVEKPTKADPEKTWTVPQGIPLDIGEASVAEALGRDWGLPVPYIHFCRIEEYDSFYSEGTVGEDGETVGAIKYMAVAFDPARANNEELRRTIVWNKKPESIASDWDATGYVGVVRTFGSYSSMKQARKDLIKALKDIHTDPTASDEEPDPYANNEYLDEVDYNDPGL
jgi:hypothetical protein